MRDTKPANGFHDTPEKFFPSAQVFSSPALSILFFILRRITHPYNDFRVWAADVIHLALSLPRRDSCAVLA